MKDRKLIFLIGVVIIVVAVITGLMVFRTKVEDKPRTELKFKEIANLKEIQEGLPDFKIDIVGDYLGVLDRNLLEAHGIKVYEFDAGIDNGWDIVTDHYIGVKMDDVVDIMIQDASYLRIGFFSRMPRSVIFTKKEMTENTYLVFSRNGKPIRSDGMLSLLVVDYEYKYSLEDVNKIQIWMYGPGGKTSVTDSNQTDEE